MEAFKVEAGDYIAVGGGYFEKVVHVDPRDTPVTAGERIDQETYQEIMRQKQEAAKMAAEARASRRESESRTDLTGLGTVAVGNLIKV